MRSDVCGDVPRARLWVIQASSLPLPFPLEVQHRPDIRRSCSKVLPRLQSWGNGWAVASSGGLSAGGACGRTSFRGRSREIGPNASVRICAELETEQSEQLSELNWGFWRCWRRMARDEVGGFQGTDFWLLVVCPRTLTRLFLSSGLPTRHDRPTTQASLHVRP